jgi:hypothetical protein
MTTYPRTYPTSDGSALDGNDYNAMRNIIYGFTPTGTFKNIYDYLIVRNGADYEAINAYQVIYGGSGDTGGVDGSSFEAVFKACLHDYATIVLDGSGGNLLVPSQAGLWLADSTGYGNFAGITLIAVNGAKLLYTYTAGASLNLFYISDGWRNCLFLNVIFDMNFTKNSAMPVYPDTSDTGVQIPASVGESWIVGVTTHSGKPTTEHVTFLYCQFLHSPDCGLNIAAADHIYYMHCKFDGFGEHVMYISENSGGTDCYDIQFISCPMLNWAKQWRGYLKLGCLHNGILSGCYCDPNEDGLGMPGILHGAEIAKAYGPIIYSSYDVTLRDCTFVGDYTGHNTWYAAGFDIDNSDTIVLDNVTITDWHYINRGANALNVKVYGGKYEDTWFSAVPKVARGVQKVTAGVTSIYDYTDGSAGDGTTVVVGAVNSEDHPSGTSFTNDSDTQCELYLDGTSGTSANTSYTVFVTVGNPKYARVSVDNGKGFYVDGHYINDADVGDWTIIYSYVVGSSITVTAKGDGNWYVTSKNGIWDIVSGGVAQTELDNTGSATILSGATSAVVTHGCSHTPKAGEIVITPTENPTNDPGNIWVDTLTSTQFTVHCRNDPGASNLDFEWAVRRISYW